MCELSNVRHIMNSLQHKCSLKVKQGLNSKRKLKSRAQRKFLTSQDVVEKREI
ncbi:unnamed protein product, partial [Sphenostylis stenocarpa]